MGHQGDKCQEGVRCGTICGSANVMDQCEREREEAGEASDHEAGLKCERRRGRKGKGVTPKGSEKVSARPMGTPGQR